MKKKTKVLLSTIVLSIVAFLGTNKIISIFAEAQYCSSISECFVNAGNGTTSNPYQISTPEQLNAMRYDLNASYILMNDIDMTHDTQDEDGLFYNDGSGWVPVGSYQNDFSNRDYNQFKGTFDGNNKAIKGLYSNSTTLSYTGLFGATVNATIKNVKLDNINIKNESSIGYMCWETETSEGGNTRGSAAGGLVGATKNSLIENIKVTGDVDAYVAGGIVGCAGYNSTIKNSSNGATITGWDTGGISAYTQGSTIQNVYNSGNILDKQSRGGGITGYLKTNSQIINAYNTGSVIGSGIVGNANGYAKYPNTITNVYNVGLATESNISSGTDSYTTISNAYGVSLLNNKSSDQLQSSDYITYSLEELKNRNVYSGFDFSSTWIIKSGYDYPQLRSIAHEEIEESNEFAGGLGKLYSPYQITTNEQLDKIRNYNYSSFILMNDLDLTYDTQNINGMFYNDGLGWEPIGNEDNKIYIIFNGNYNKITGLKANRDSYSGLFGNISNSIISNITLKDVDINSTAHAGGIVAFASNSSIENAVVSGDVTGFCWVGGVAGYTSSTTLTKIANLSNVNYNEDRQCYNRGAGGIVGVLSSGLLENSYNAGNINNGAAGGLVGYKSNADSIMQNCYNVGKVNSSDSNSGAVIGNLYGGTINNVYTIDYGKQLIGRQQGSPTNNNLVTKSMLELKDINTYSSWDNFSDNFKIETVDGITRLPVLKNNSVTYVDDISVDVDEITLKIGGKNSQPINAVLDKKGISADTVVIESDNNDIATVDSNGNVIGISTGNTNVRVFGYDGYEVVIPVHVIELTYTSDKYDLSNPYIYVGGNDFDLDAINVVNGSKAYEDYKLSILDDDYVVREIDIVKISSDKIDVNNEYLLNGQSMSNISVTNGYTSGYTIRYKKGNASSIDVFTFKSNPFREQSLYNCVVDEYNKVNNTSIPYTEYLGVDKFTTITYLDCNGLNKSDDDKITGIGTGLSYLTELTELHLENNKLTGLDLRSNSKLKKLYVDNNNIAGLYVDNLEILSATNNSRISPDLSKSTSLKELYLSNSSSTSITKNTELLKLDLSNCNIYDIDLSNNTKLEYVNLNSNHLSSINVANNTELKELYLNNNNIMRTGNLLDFSNNTKLTKLEVASNSVFDIDVSANTDLDSLVISNNFIQTLDLSNNVKISNLQANNNRLKNIDLSSNKILNTIDLSENQFKCGVGAYNGDYLDLSNMLCGVILPEGKQVTFKELSDPSEGLEVNGSSVKGTENKSYDVSATYIVDDNDITVTYSIRVNQVQSRKDYIINSSDNYIFTNTDIDSEVILNNLYLYTQYYSGPFEKELMDNQLIIKADNKVLKSFKIINISADDYEINNDFIYTGSNDIDLSKINVLNASLQVSDNKLNLKYNDKTIYSYDLVKVYSNKYDLSKNYIFDIGEIDIDSITVTNATKTVTENDNTLRIYHNDEYVTSYNLATISSNTYDLTKDYIYIGTGDFDKSNIERHYTTLDLTGNKLSVYYLVDELLKEYTLVGIKFGGFKTYDNVIIVPSETTYEDFINNITPNGVTYKIYNEEVEVTEENITEGMKVKVYKDEEVIDEYEVTNEYLEIDESLNIDEDSGIIEDLTIGQTIEEILSNISTSGNIKVLNGETEVTEGAIGTGYKVVIELSNDTIEYELSVKGDVTGTGKVTMADVMKTATHMLEGNVIEGNCYLKAADVTGDGNIRMSDVMKIANYVLEGGSL